LIADSGSLAALSWGIVVIGAVLGLRLALKPPFRRDLAALPALRRWLVMGGLAFSATGAWLMVRVPLLLHLTALFVLTAMVGLWWRARPSYGRRKRWPPGSLGIGASLDAIDNRDFYLQQAALHGPVFKMSQFGRPVLCVLGLARGRELLQAHRSSLAAASLSYNRFALRGMLRYMPRVSHQSEGPLFRRAFSSIDLAGDEQRARAALRRRLATFASQQTEGADIRPLIRSWATVSLSRSFFGLGEDDTRVGILDAAQQSMDVERAGGAAWRLAMERGLSSATSVLRDAGRELATRGDSGSVLGSLVAAAPETLDDEARLRNLFFMFRLGIGDLSAALSWVVYHVATHPAWQERVRAAGRTGGPPPGMQPTDIGSRIVLETLRLEQSEFLYRRVAKPIEFEGFHIPSGWIVRICIQESHRDNGTFPDPATFNPDRFSHQSYARSEYATFGLDEHGCLGASMVHFFGRVLAEELCIAYQATTIRDSPLERGTRHRHHWRPGQAWCVRLDPLPATIPS
jgi:cytochrome P450